MVEFKVELGERAYPIFIGGGLLADSGRFSPFIGSSQALLVTNETVDKLYSDQVMKSLSFVGKLNKLVLPDGEKFKNLDTLNLIFDALLESQHNRKTTLIALGGGVVGDMVGFAAAAYQRGVDFIQVPTTLLSQVDSSVGGKAGVNHALGKNMIGAFHQPNCVVIDTNVLATLPDRELSAGLAEVIKYGLIYDDEFFVWLEQNMSALVARDVDALTYAIDRSCRIKAAVVAQDEKEGGIRAILNFGHTFGHAIEAHQGYGNWLHGEAVGTGMVMACEMSHRLDWIDGELLARSKALIAAAGLPVLAPEDMGVEDFLKYMSVDKKVLDGALRLVLLKGCGEAVVTSDFALDVLKGTLGEAC